MNGIASRGQLRLSYLRWALVTVPAIVFLGFLSGQLANSGYGNRWFAALDKPALMPPGWAFGVAWTILYVLMALAFAIVLHQVDAALILIVALIVAVGLTIRYFWRIRRLAGILMLPYLAWLCFAAVLNYEIGRLNPDAETLVAPALRAQVR